MKWTDFRADERKKIDLKDYPTAPDKKTKEEKDSYIEKTAKNLEKIAALQERLYADGREGMIIVLQAMDAAGKDSTIKHVLSSLNPQGVDVYSFKAPNSTELSHDYLHRVTACLPPRGKIAIFNRSHYEDVLVVKVHQINKSYHMPDKLKGNDIFEKRYRQIRHFEEYLHENGLRMVKIFLNVSKDEQKARFLERIDTPDKNWKFNAGDLKEREFFKDYQNAYEDAITETGTKAAPWYIVPADKKWFTRYVVSEIVKHTLEQIDPQSPKLSDEDIQKLPEYKQMLENE
jgi:polyphosphate:nucleotide phosphotransferase, PPK2 family